jgi:hypothetical protein
MSQPSQDIELRSYMAMKRIHLLLQYLIKFLSLSDWILIFFEILISTSFTLSSGVTWWTNAIKQANFKICWLNVITCARVAWVRVTSG